jgi:hypothetical protein
VTDRIRLDNISGNVSIGGGAQNTGSGHQNVGGNQNTGSGNQYVAGGDVSVGNVTGVDPAVIEAIAGLRAQLGELRLTSSEREAVEADLTAVEEAGEDKEAAAGAFESLLDRLKQAGALADAGAGFMESASKILRWLGPLAAGAIALL